MLHFDWSTAVIFMVQRLTPSRIVFNVLNYGFLALFSVSVLIPFLNAFALSLSVPEAVRAGTVYLWPVGFNISSYKLIFLDKLFTITILNTVALTTVNTVLVVFIALFAGYALQSKDFKHVKLATLYILIPMYFSGGLVPTYMLINSWLGWRDSYLALILPVVTSPFLIIILRNNIANLPKEMSESAEIDGANDIVILLKILLPLILPTVMAFVIFNAVGYWNEWFNCMLYIQSPTKYTMQYKLRQILATSTVDFKTLQGLAVSVKDVVHPQNIKMAALLVTILPIMCIYPFLQRYFIHGVIVGALKE